MNTDCNAPLKNNFTKEIPKESNICLSYDINLSKSLTAVVAFNTKRQASQDVHKCKTKATVKCFLGHSQQLWGNKTYSRLPGVPRGCSTKWVTPPTTGKPRLTQGPKPRHCSVTCACASHTVQDHLAQQRELKHAFWHHNFNL